MADEVDHVYEIKRGAPILLSKGIVDFNNGRREHSDTLDCPLGLSSCKEEAYTTQNYKILAVIRDIAHLLSLPSAFFAYV